MNKHETIHIVHLHASYKYYRTGIDRYLDMLLEGINDNKEYRNIYCHTIYFTDNKEYLFPKVNIDKNERISALIPFPQNDYLLHQSFYWKDKYNNIVSTILEPYLKGKNNLIFHCHNLYLTHVAEDLKKRFGGKYINHMHCLPWKFTFMSDSSLFKTLYQLYQESNYNSFKEKEDSKINYKNADKTICLSNAARNYLINIHQLEEKKLVNIYNGLSIQEYKQQERENLSKPVILYVGKVSKDKGAYELLDSLVKVKSKNIDFKVVMAGTCNLREIKRIRSIYSVIEPELLGQISFEELKRLYATCTIGVIPSIHEQCSYVALEMALFGVPLIVSNVDALSEMFIHEESVLLTPLSFDTDFGLEINKDILVENIIRLLVDKKLRLKLSQNIHKNYQKNFLLKNMVNNTVNMYNSLV